MAKSWTVSGPSIIQNLMKNTSTHMNKLFQPKFSLSHTHIYILPGGVFVSRIGVDGRSKRRRRRRGRGRRVGIGGGSGSPWSGVELGLYTRKSTASPVMNIVRSRQVYRIRHRQYFDHTLSNKKYYLSVFSSILVVEFRSGVEFLKLRLPFVLQSVQLLLTSHRLNIIVIIW